MAGLRCFPLLILTLGNLSAVALGAVPAQDAAPMSLDELRPGQRGEVWTVFRGTEPEAFAVEVAGVVRNALGPGKSLIVCELTDPRVQNMGAVAGMSGSPLYIEGRLAGALSYQIQRFETVRHAGFTPVSDLEEVRQKGALAGPGLVSTSGGAAESSGATAGYRAMQPVFTLGGLSPAVAELFAPRFAALGLTTLALGGSTPTGSAAAAGSNSLQPGASVAVALATGDITLAGTGTVSRIQDRQVTAFGHPMLSLGEVALPMCSTEIVTILPSQMQSVKVANTGQVIGTVTQDRLSGVTGTLGAGPEMTKVEVTVRPTQGAPRVLNFAVARHQQMTPVIVAAGLTQAIVGSNDAGFVNGFRLASDIRFPASAKIGFHTLYSGPQGFLQGLNEFIQGLAANLQNPYAKTFPEHVAFSIEPLATNPSVTLDLFQLSRAQVPAGGTVQVTVAWRDWQGEEHREVLELPIDPAWAGRQLEVVLAPGRVLDELTGRPRLIPAAELRSFEAYLEAIRDDRATDGVYLAVVQRTTMFSDQTVTTPETPGSIERIARAADEARFRKRDAVLPLWEKHLLPGKLFSAVVRRPLTILE